VRARPGLTMAGAAGASATLRHGDLS
jgi:hypothetical protein